MRVKSTRITGFLGIILICLSGCFSGKKNTTESGIYEPVWANNSSQANSIMVNIEAHRPWLLGAIILFIAVLALILMILHRSKRQSAKFKKDHEHVRIMLDTIPIACFIGTGKEKLSDCNDEAVRLFELKDKNEFLSIFEDKLSPEYQPDGRNSIAASSEYTRLTYEKGKQVFQWMYQLKDGTPVPSLVTLERVMYGDDIAILAYIRDMRERTKMSGEIDQQNELLKAVYQVSTILLEPDTMQLENKYMLAMSIIARAVNINRVTIWKNHTIDDESYSSLIYEWPKNNKIDADNSVTQNIPNGETRWRDILSRGGCINSMVRELPLNEQTRLKAKGVVSIFIVPVFIDTIFWGYVGFDDCRRERIFTINENMILRSAGRMFGNVFVRNNTTKTLIDTTAQLEIEKERAEQSSRSKTIFLSHMSHEIRTPMNAILGIAEIQLQNGNLSPDTGEAFSKIYESGDLLLNIINDILDLSKIESGKLELVSVHYDIPSLINDTVQLNRLRYESKPIEFLLRIDENAPLELLGDELRIKQVLNNILSNAFKYTNEGTVEFSVSAESIPGNETQDNDVMLIFCVSDTGQGMTEDQVSKLFDEYTRFNLETNRTTVGAGLGMTITKRLVDLMNGTILVQSEPDKGTVFTVRLPQKRIGTSLCGAEFAEKLRKFNYQSTTLTKKMQFMREYMPYGKVLVVDDVESNIYVIRGMLIPYGLKIEAVSNGFDAIEKIKNGNIYDIIFMDHMMPKMDGIKATKIIREAGYTHNIVALTANALVGREEMFLQNGFDGFISKPVDSRELNLILNDFIRNKKSPDVVKAARDEQQSKKEKNTQMKTYQPLPEIKKFFIQDAKNAMQVLDDLMPKIHELNNEETETYIITVHGMKSALANIGENELSGIALQLEMAGKNRELAILADKTPVFINALGSLCAQFKEYEQVPVQPEEEENSSAEITGENALFLHEKLLEIAAACDIYDKLTAKAALDELKQKLWPDHINTVLDELAVHILHSAFKRAAVVAENTAETCA